MMYHHFYNYLFARRKSLCPVHAQREVTCDPLQGPKCQKEQISGGHFNIYLFILAALGLSWGMWNLLMWLVRLGSLVRGHSRASHTGSSPTLGAWSLSHWTRREVQGSFRGNCHTVTSARAHLPRAVASRTY